MNRLVLLLFFPFLAAVSTAAAEEKNEDAFNLGPLGAEGLPIPAKEAKARRISDFPAVRVTAVDGDGPAAAAGIARDDVIFGVNGRSLPARRDPVLALMERIDASLSAPKPRVVLSVLRGNRRIPLPVTLEPLGKHAAACPRSCPRCDAQIRQSLEWLVSRQRPDGSWDVALGGTNGRAVATSVAGLALLASGSTPVEGPYAEAIRRAAAFVAKYAGTDSAPSGEQKKGANWNQANWSLGYAPLLLCEVYRHQPTDALSQRIAAILRDLAANQEASGGWAHGPGGPNALGYLELEIVGNWCLSSVGAAKRLGFTFPDEKLKKALDYVRATSSGDGGIGYSTRAGQQGFGDPGRTAGAIFAWSLLGMKNDPFFRRMTSYLQNHLDGIPEGHVSPVMHYTQAALACCHLEPEVWKEFLDLFRLEFIAARKPDGSFAARPTAETRQLRSNTDRQMGPAWTTASYLLVLQIRKGHLALLDGTYRPAATPKR